jgi:undecaprenyl-diphosphatase
MMERLLELDRECLIRLNSFHSSWMDTVMMWVTRTDAWIPLYLFLIYLVIRSYRKDSWILLLGAAITILIADQVTSQLMKPYFARLRPSQDPALIGIIHLVDGYKGGLYGFASSHAANTFGAAFFCWTILRSRYKWMWLLFIWASLMTYSRIYLGVHYPGDILVGMLVGIFASFLALAFSGFLMQKLGRNEYHGFSREVNE